MNLTEGGESVRWTQTHYVFVERTGPISKIAPATWQAVLGYVRHLAESNRIDGRMSLYKTVPSVYRAGFVLPREPKSLPPGLEYELFPGGMYRRFVLTGPYSQLGAATGRAFEWIAQEGLTLRSDFCIESYVNDPQTTPEDGLVTEILLPAD